MRTLTLICTVIGAIVTAQTANGAPRMEIKDKTLVVWAVPANLKQRGGSALTLDDMKSRFDGIIFGELAQGKWMAGSDYHRRSQKDQQACPAETADQNTFVQVAIVYEGKKITVSYHDPILQEDMILNPEMVALSVGIVPEETETMSKLLKVPITGDNFYLEAHVKLRPVELPVDGVYVCGLAHAPKPVDEIVVQAQAAAAKAAIPLVKGYVAVDPIVSNVDKDTCIGCNLCVSLCPYQAIKMVKDENKKRKAETVVASCKACGICIAFCPQKVFEPDRDGKPIIVRPEDCTQCAFCWMHCPDLAIISNEK